MQDAVLGDDPVGERLRLTYEATHTRLWRSVLAFAGSREVADEAVAEARPYALDPDAARRLWAISEELVDESFPDPSPESDD